MIWFLASLALAGLGLYGLVYAVNAYRRYRYVVDLPTSTVQAAAVGLTEVKGRAVPAEETITSPFGEQPCLLCHYICVYWEGAERSFEAGTLGVPFYLEDATGRLLIRPQGAEIKLPQHLTELSTHFLGKDAGGDAKIGSPASMQRFLERKRNGTLPQLHSGRAEVLNYMFEGAGMDAAEEAGNAGKTNASSGRAPRFVEARLEEGDATYVLGMAQPREAEAVAAGEAAQNERNLFIGAAPGSKGPFWSSYESIFEIATGSEENLVNQSRREVWQQVGQGVLMFAFGLGCLVLVLLYGCGS